MGVQGLEDVEAPKDDLWLWRGKGMKAVLGCEGEVLVVTQILIILAFAFAFALALALTLALALALALIEALALNLAFASGGKLATLSKSIICKTNGGGAMRWRGGQISMTGPSRQPRNSTAVEPPLFIRQYNRIFVTIFRGIPSNSTGVEPPLYI